MKGFIGLTKRNLLKYFMDIQSVFFSVMTSIIVLGLYLLFLRNNFVDAITSALGELEKLIDMSDCDVLVDGILLSGVIGTAMITVPFNCLSTIIKDKENKIDYDISATPLKRWQIILSYFLSSAVSAFFMTGVILTVGLVALSQTGDLHMAPEMIMGAYGVVLLGCISATAFFMIIMLFFKSSSASSAFFGILSAASGFVIGAYLPISQFSKTVQTFCNLFPASHITAMMRNVLLNGVLENIDKSIGGLDNGMFIDTMKEVFTFNPYAFGMDFTQQKMVLYAIAITLACIIIMIFAYSKTYKRK